MPGKIFISYRRIDSNETALLIAASLKERYGVRQVFIDENLSGGQVFPDELEKRLDESVVALALIGSRWLNAVDTDGRRRLENEDDWVRQEIRRTLQRRIHLIPVLINGASMPTAAELPFDISTLAVRHAVNVRTIDQSFKGDVKVLFEAIDNVRAPRSRIDWRWGGALAAVFLIAGLVTSYLRVVATPTPGLPAQTDPADAVLRAKADWNAKAQAEEIARAKAEAVREREERQRSEAQQRETEARLREAEARERAALEEKRRVEEREAMRKVTPPVPDSAPPPRPTVGGQADRRTTETDPLWRAAPPSRSVPARCVNARGDWSPGWNCNGRHSSSYVPGCAPKPCIVDGREYYP